MTSEQTQNSTEAERNIQGHSSQYLTFIVDDEEYGVDILRVQEIKGWEKVTEIPNTPDYVKGVLNLRGAIVPVVDMRKRFGMESIEYGKTTVIVVLKVMTDKGERIMGFVVDAVSDVYNVNDEELQRPPDFDSLVNAEFIRGLATVDEKMVMLLNIDHLIAA